MPWDNKLIFRAQTKAEPWVINRDEQVLANFNCFSEKIRFMFGELDF